MHYEGDIYRPPSEAYSLIIQVTVGCTHNKCSFCYMYKGDRFKLKPFETVLEDMQEARRYYRHVERIFFADGDALCMTTEKITRLLETARSIFPECTRVGVYSRALHILRKSEDDLIKLRELGLGIVYIGAESGSDDVLLRINKGETARQIIEAVQKVERSGIKASVTFISGMGGKELMMEHAAKTGQMISEMGASYVGFLTLRVYSVAPLYTDIQSGAFEQLSTLEVLDELEIILEHTNCSGETVFRSNHASNWLVLKGVLPHDKAKLISQIRFAKENPGVLRDEVELGL